MKVRFMWFWSTFNPDENFFLEILRLNYDCVEVVKDPNAKCDLEIVSCFVPVKNSSYLRLTHLLKSLPHGQPDINLIYPSTFNPKTKNYRKRIWYGPENLRPPYQEGLEGTLSFDQDTLSGFNAYCPNWYELAGIVRPYFNPRVGLSINAEQLLESRKLERIKTKFACAFIGKSDQMRFRAIHELRKIDEVDVFGPLVGKPIVSKTEIAKEYRYILCFENDLYPGYVTEKPMEAYLAQAVPLYWGRLGDSSVINDGCLINLDEFDSMANWVDYIASIDDSSYRGIYQQPFLKKIPDLSAITKILTAQ